MLTDLDTGRFKNILKTLLAISLILAGIWSNSIYAGAAEKWDLKYAIDNSTKTLKVSGHKVDQYGDAVNDRTYQKSYKLNTLKTNNLAKLSLRSRVLRNPQLAVGSAALVALLGYLGFEFFKGKWGKKPDQDTTYSDYQFHSGTVGNPKCVTNSPYKTASCALIPSDQYRNYALEPYDYLNITNFPRQGYFQHPYSSIHKITGETDTGTFSIYYKPTKTNPSPNPDPSSEPSPLSDADIDKIVDDHAGEIYFPWDDIFADPDVKIEIEKDFDSQVSKEITTRPELDSDGNPTGLSTSELPEACEWFNVVCEFIDWVKAEPENVEEPEKQVEEENLDHLLNSMKVSYIQGNAYCPADNKIPINIANLNSHITLSYQPFCALANQARPAVILIAWVVAAFIVTGTSRKASED